jgi:hypothetical protein
MQLIDFQHWISHGQTLPVSVMLTDLKTDSSSHSLRYLGFITAAMRRLQQLCGDYSNLLQQLCGDYSNIYIEIWLILKRLLPLTENVILYLRMVIVSLNVRRVLRWTPLRVSVSPVPLLSLPPPLLFHQSSLRWHIRGWKKVSDMSMVKILIRSQTCAHTCNSRSQLQLSWSFFKKKKKKIKFVDLYSAYPALPGGSRCWEHSVLLG